MGDRTGIEWTDASWTPIRARHRATGKLGWHCVHVSPGCKHCYAESWNKPRGTGLPFKPGHAAEIEIILDERMLLAPLRWRAPRRIFVCSMTDLFAEFVPDAMIDRVFAVMALAPQHTFQLLTKRAARMRAYVENARHRVGAIAFVNALRGAGRASAEALRHAEHRPWPLPNVWLGVSAEDQATADARVPELLATPAAVRFVSAEPLLGPIDFTMITLRAHNGLPTDLSRRLGDYVRPLEGNFRDSPKLDWIIVGGESGAGARPMHPDWARSIRDQCVRARTAFFFKQWGEWLPCGDWYAEHPVSLPLRVWNDGGWTDKPELVSPSAEWVARLGKARAGRLLDGFEHSAMPEARRHG